MSHLEAKWIARGEVHIMTIVRSLAGWIAFAVAGAFLDQQIAAVTAVVVAIAVLLLARHGGRRTSELVIEIATVIFFACYTVLAFAVPHAGLRAWVGPASQFWLAATVAITLAIRRPFTLAIARREAPPAVWDAPPFVAFNVRITRAWMISFLLSGLVLAGFALLGWTRAWFTAPVMVAAIIVTIVFTKGQTARLREGFRS